MTKQVATEEILDWVDENDQVIGAVARSKANSDPKYTHREVGVLIVDPDNRVLVQKRSLKRKVLPGVWTISAAGHVPKGQLPLDAAKRELLEELGFDTDIKFVDKLWVEAPSETHFRYVYLGDFPADAEIDFDPEEIADVRWLSEDDLGLALAAGDEFDAYSLDSFRKFWHGEFESSPLSSS